jgi:hypothetical protein
MLDIKLSQRIVIEVWGAASDVICLDEMRMLHSFCTSDPRTWSVCKQSVASGET